jgi:hypothetical protein
MSTKGKLLAFAISATFGFFMSLAIIMAVWASFEHRAFNCTDGMGGIFWDSIDAHQAAGDMVLSGWTWQKIKAAQGFYETGFIVLWFAIAVTPALVLRRKVHAKAT